MKDLKLFDSKKIHSSWDAEQEKWYFSIVDVVDTLTDSPNPLKCWSVLKNRINNEGGELTTICSHLKKNELYEKNSQLKPQNFNRLQTVTIPKTNELHQILNANMPNFEKYF